MRIIIVAGGTGGHLFPAIRLAEEIILKYTEVFILTSSRIQDSAILKNRGIKFYKLSITNLKSKSVLSILKFLFWLVVGTLESLYLLIKIRPFCVVGFGGYVSGPILLLASSFRVRTIIHEQNVVPGKANRILAPFVTKIAVSFPETQERLTNFNKKIILSGNLLRKEILLLKPKDGDGGVNFKLLVIGGSQGSSALNKFLPLAIDLIEEDKKRLLEVSHISGYREKDIVESSYNKKAIKNRVIPFIDKIDSFYDECDFIVARAGATTVSEILYIKKPCILIPYPYGDKHQIHNARVLEKIGLAKLIEEPDLTADALAKLISSFMDRNRLKAITGKVNISNTDGARILIEEIFK